MTEAQPDFFTEDPEDELFSKGKDELNLAEFPLTSLSTRANPGQKTLEFKDTIWDKGNSQLVERKLTIAASDRFGLPTAGDDEVILGLVQLSQQQGFHDRTVVFSRYQLLRILGWPDTAAYYRRIDQALDRWVDVTLKYENAWWDASQKSWMNETFHILSRLTTVVNDESGDKENAFVWDDVIFKSFQSGNLKALDLDIYRHLNSQIAKRLYRLLDKRFFHRHHVEFDLQNLALHKLGLSPNYTTAQLKRKLAGPMDELVAVKFLKPMSVKNRFVKIKAGEWNVIFERQTQQKELPIEIPTTNELESKLVAVGITPNTARSLAAKKPEPYIAHKLEILAFLQTDDKSAPSNPAGWLVKAIQDDYPAPKGFKSASQRKEELERLQKLKEQRKAKQQAEEEAKAAEEAAKLREEEETNQRVKDYLDQLSAEELALVEAEAHRLGCQSYGKKWMEQKTKIGEVHRKLALTEYVLSILDPVSVGS